MQLAMANTCHRCPLSKTRTKIVWCDAPESESDPDPSPRVMLIAEAPGKTEDKFGYPFVDQAPAGMEMNQLLARIGLPRGTVWVTNLVKCHPPGDRDPTSDEIDSCSLWLDMELERIMPDFLVTVGRASTRHFLGDVDMEGEHGIPRMAMVNGNVVTVIPVYHPAAGLHHPETMLMVQGDFQVVRGVVRGEIPPYGREDEYPSPMYVEIRDDQVE